MRKKLVAGNWKMNMTKEEAVSFFETVSARIKDRAIVFAPFTLLATLSELANEHLEVGAQNMYFEESGAFTGEISADMLLDFDIVNVVLGHSERRGIFKESDDEVHQKLCVALEKNMNPIVCVGESLETREAGKAEVFVKSQVEAAFRAIGADDAEKVLVAYEPIWAIGTGKTASSADAERMCAAIREVLRASYGDVAERISILYGGSVKPSNIDELMACENIDGALVGGASLKTDSFVEMVEIASKYNR